MREIQIKNESNYGTSHTLITVTMIEDVSKPPHNKPLYTDEPTVRNEETCVYKNI